MNCHVNPLFNMFAISRLFILLMFAFFTHTIVSGQYTTFNNYTGNWNDVNSWVSSNTPAMPFDASGGTIDIYGFITSNSTIQVDKGTLNIQSRDTLVVYGDLIIGNNGSMIIGDYSVLIVYGNVSIANKVDIATNGYFVVAGNLSFSGSYNHGSFTSDLTTPQVYVAGTVSTPSGPANYTNFPVLECGTGTHNNTGCNYGDFVDLQGSSIADFVNGGCVPKPTITSISSNSPVSIGNTINLSTYGDVGTGGSWPLTYSWNGPQAYSSTAQYPSIPSATQSMTGYYTVNYQNANGCITKDSTFVDVPTSNCCNGSQVISRDNYTGDWEEATTWATTNETWRAIPPPTNPLYGFPTCINGYVTVNGDLTLNGGGLQICDTLVITGDLYLINPTFTIESTGLLIVLGNLVADTNGANGTTVNDGGRVVFVGEFDKNPWKTIGGSGDYYIFDDTPNPPDFPATGNEDTLAQNDPNLYDFVFSMISGVCSLSYTNSLTNVTCNNGNDGAIDLTISGATAPITYSWDNGEITEDIAGLIAGDYTVIFTDAALCTDSATFSITEPVAISINIGSNDTICVGNVLIFDAGSGYSSYSWNTGETTQIINFTGPIPTGTNISITTTINVSVTDGNNCTTTSSSVEIITYRIPQSGTINHISNDLYK